MTWLPDDYFRGRMTMHGSTRKAVLTTPAGTAKRQAASAQPGGTGENTRQGSPERAERHGGPSFG